MNIAVQHLPSGGYGYDFPDIEVSPMAFLKITEYLENLPEHDKLEKYLYEINDLLKEDQRILNCYLMDVDFLIFFKKLITVSGDNTLQWILNALSVVKLLSKRFH